MIGEVGLTDHEKPGNRTHEVVIDPQTSHRIMDGGINSHGYLVGVLRCILSYISKRFPYFSRTTSVLRHLIASVKSRKTPRPLSPTPRPSSQTSFAAREATSRGTRLPKLGYLRSR